MSGPLQVYLTADLLYWNLGANVAERVQQWSNDLAASSLPWIAYASPSINEASVVTGLGGDAYVYLESTSDTAAVPTLAQLQALGDGLTVQRITTVAQASIGSAAPNSPGDSNPPAPNGTTFCSWMKLHGVDVCGDAEQALLVAVVGIVVVLAILTYVKKKA